MRNIGRKFVGPLVVMGGFVALWYVAAYNIDNNFSPSSGRALILPPPHRMFEGVNHSIGSEILTAGRITLLTALTGLAVSIALGWAIALIMGFSRSIESAFWPFLVALQAIPIVALVPLLIQLVGVNSRARVVVVVLITLFPIVSGAVDGLNHVSRSQLELFRLYGASRTSTMKHLRAPNAVPHAMGGVKVASGLAVVGAIVGDFFFARGDLGLGRLITEYFQNTQPGPMLLASGVAAILGLLFFSSVSVIAQQLSKRWSPQISSDVH